MVSESIFFSCHVSDDIPSYVVEASLPMIIPFSVIHSANLALMKAFGPKCQPFIKITNIFVDYTKKNSCGNACPDYIIS